MRALRFIPYVGLLAAAVSAVSFGAAPAAPVPAAPSFGDAPHVVQPERGPVMAAALAGTRMVAVGDYGLVLLSDDGQRYRQASHVPVRSPLTSVFFLDAKTGWAAGHDGTVIGTSDGGEHWKLLRQEPGKERVLLSVWFENAQHGWAVGQFGLALETADGGATWQERRLVEDPEQSDKHLMQLFAGPKQSLYIAAESGTVFRSDDAGAHWSAAKTDNVGSFWAGLALPDGGLVVAGLRGHIWRSGDGGQRWSEVPSNTQQSITALALAPDGHLWAAGLSGTWLESPDQGRSFRASVRADRANLTALVPLKDGPRLFSLCGVVAKE